MSDEDRFKDSVYLAKQLQQRVIACEKERPREMFVTRIEPLEETAIDAGDQPCGERKRK